MWCISLRMEAHGCISWNQYWSEGNVRCMNIKAVQQLERAGRAATAVHVGSWDRRAVVHVGCWG